MSALFTFPFNAKYCLTVIAAGRPWALHAALHLNFPLDLSGRRLELAVLFAGGAFLMLCSMLVRKAAAAPRRPAALAVHGGESPASPLPLAEGAKR